MLPLLSLFCVLPADTAQPVRVFDTDSGLPHNRVNRIYRDSKNFLWICTDDGLSRFDGHQFVTYTTANGLPHKYVNAMLETRTGEYWVATDGGVSLFDPRPRRTRFTTYSPSGPLDARHVNGLIEEPDGSLLLATSAGLYRFRVLPRPGSFEPVEFGHPRNAQHAVMVNAIARDARGSLWLATDHGLYCQHGRNSGWTYYGVESGLALDRWIGAEPAAFVDSFAHERNGRLWVAFKGGFGRIAIDPKPGSSVLDFAEINHSGLGREVRALWFGTDGRRWIGTESGLWEWGIDASGVSSFRQHTIQDRFPREAFLSIGEDNADNLWLGTRRSGLVGVASSRFQTFGATDGLQLGLDQLLIEVRPGQIAVFDVGGKRSKVYLQEGRRFTALLPALPEQVASTPYWLHVAMEDHEGGWWFSTTFGLFRFPTVGGRFDLRLLPESKVGRFFEDSVGQIWISHSIGGGNFPRLARWERHSGVVHDESGRLPPDVHTGIVAFAQDHTGTMWIGLQHPDDRLLRLKEGRFQAISADWHGHINQMFVDSKGRLWATSTESGLGLIANPNSGNPHLRRYTRAEGLSADEVWCVTEDRLGRIYAGTAKGVDRLDPDTGEIVHYSTADGLAGGDIRSALRDRKGDLWFASAHGVSKFKPSEDRRAAPSRARITGLRTAGVPFPLSEFGETDIGPVRFSSHQNSLQIDFAATDYRAQTPLRYQFWLDRKGRSERAQTWQDLGTNSTVHLIDLAPGDFSFRVQALAPDGLPGEPASIAFAILQPFWRTWWFQLACAMAIAGLAYWVRTRRLQQQLTMERVRSHIAMDLHDDIGAGLSRIFVISEALKTRLRADDDDVQRMLNDVADSSRRLVADMGDIVWSLDPRHDRIGELASRLRAFGSDLLEARGVEWTVEAPAEELHQNVSPALRRQLYLVFKEAINNVGKHSNARKANLRLWFQDGNVCGQLTDDGCGITAGGRNGTGLPSMRARVTKLAGDFEISATAGGGTSVRISIPLSKRA